jgi:hypothetical protein
MNIRGLLMAAALAAIGLWQLTTPAAAQAVICSLTPDAATSNQICANTAFVHKAIAASGSVVNVPPTVSWFSNDTPPANINRLADSLLVGDAVNNLRNSSCGGSDWFATFEATTSNGPCGYIGAFALVAEASPTNANGDSGVFGAGQTKNTGSASIGAFGLTGIALNNNAAGPGGGPQGAWGIYGECDYIVHNTHVSPCFGLELETSNFIADVDAGAPDAFQQGPITSLQIGCGSGFTIGGVGSFKCSAAANVVNVGNQFIVGLNFLSNSIATQTLFGGIASVAISLPENYGLVWYSAAATPVAGVDADSGGSLKFVSTGTIVINGIVSVSCTSGTVNAATVVVTDGIVTHC